ncbi:MAG: LysM peptidoglycan-binding domain-containing protein [Chloroflexi bacterium]|nr:LysM peptidoglycan-binding domain-containing protein [Chloroflexota bacterium]
MVCYVCQQDAIGTCLRCGRRFCQAHGRDRCRDCASPLRGLPAHRTYRAVALASLALAGLAVVFLQVWPTSPAPQPRMMSAAQSTRPGGSPAAAPALDTVTASPPLQGTATPTASPTPVPTSSPSPTPAATPTPSPSPPAVQHTVAPGDTLLDLALRYDSSVEAIVRVNNLRDEHALQIGQVLTIPR